MNNKLACLITTLCFSISLPIYADNEDYSNQDVSGMDFSRVSHNNSTWENCYIKEGKSVVFADGYTTYYLNSNFRNAKLNGAIFHLAILINADFTGAEIKGADFSSVGDILEKDPHGLSTKQLYSTASYQKKDLGSIKLRNCDLIGWNFRGCNLTGAQFNESKLLNTDLSDAEITEANFSLSKGLLFGTISRTASYKRKDLRGVDFSFVLSRSYWDFSGIDLTGACFAGTDFGKVNFSGAKIKGADFSGTDSTIFSSYQLYSTASYKNRDLSGIYLSNKDLQSWNFKNQNLAGANFEESNLKNADLTEANLRSSRFNGADLTGANLTNTDLRGVTFGSRYSAEKSAVLEGANFTNANLENVALYNVNLKNVNFTGANLTNVKFYDRFASSGSSSYLNVRNANFTNAILRKVDFSNIDVSGVNFNGTTANGFTAEQLYSTTSYKRRNLSGVSLANNDMSGWNFQSQNLENTNFSFANLEGANLRSAKFVKADLTNVNFTKADLTGVMFGNFWMETDGSTASTLKGAIFSDSEIKNTLFYCATSHGFTSEQLYSTADYKRGELSVGFYLNDLSNWNFQGQNLKGTAFVGSMLKNTDFTGSFISNVAFSQATSYGFTKEQLYSTASYKKHDLSGIWLRYNDLAGWNFMNQNLTDAKFDSAILTNTDFRGSEGFYYTTGDYSPIYKNTLMRDGTIKNFTMESLEDSFRICKYEPDSPEGDMISAKIVEDASISGGAQLTLNAGAQLDVSASLTIDKNSAIVVETDLSDSTRLSIKENSSIFFEDGAILSVNLLIDYDPSIHYSFTVMDWEDSSSITEFLKKGLSLLLKINDEDFSGLWDIVWDKNHLEIVVIPESAECAVIFGVLALGFAAYRRRK